MSDIPYVLNNDIFVVSHWEKMFCC